MLPRDPAVAARRTPAATSTDATEPPAVALSCLPRRAVRRLACRVCALLAGKVDAYLSGPLLRGSRGTAVHAAT